MNVDKIQTYQDKNQSPLISKEMKETIGNMNKIKSWFFEKIYKIDKH